MSDGDELITMSMSMSISLPRDGDGRRLRGEWRTRCVQGVDGQGSRIKESRVGWEDDDDDEMMMTSMVIGRSKHPGRSLRITLGVILRQRGWKVMGG